MDVSLPIQPDLLAIAERDTRLVRQGKEYHGPCVFCGAGRDRFWVRPADNRWFCRRCTPQGGDAISYVMRRERVPFRQALAVLTGTPTTKTTPRPGPDPDIPPPAWRERAERLCVGWAEQLWSPTGTRALAWLRGRGLADETIAGAGLGYCPVDERVGGWSYARGITIPVWAMDGLLYGVRIRRPVPRDARGRGKYTSLVGSRSALYGTLRPSEALVITEGYFDCLLAAQLLSDTAVATMNLCRPAGRWLRYLLPYRRVLVCLDADEAGAAGWRHWSWIGTAERVALPAGKDITRAVVDHGVDLAAWVAEQLRGTMEPPVPAPQAAPIVHVQVSTSDSPDRASIPRTGEQVDRWMVYGEEAYF